MPDRSVSAETKNWLFHLGGWGFSILATWWGLVILLQEPSRMSNRGWTVAMSAPGGTVFWGAWMLGFGLLMLLAMALGHRGRPLMLVAAIAVAFALFGRFVASVLAMSDPTVSGTGPPAWLAFTCIYLAQGLVHARAFSR